MLKGKRNASWSNKIKSALYFSSYHPKLCILKGLVIARYHADFWLSPIFHKAGYRHRGREFPEGPLRDARALPPSEPTPLPYYPAAPGFFRRLLVTSARVALP